MSLRAHFDDTTVTVLQSHAVELAEQVVAAGRFNVPGWHPGRTTRFRLSLGSALLRSERGMKPGRERLLAVKLSRSGFDELLNMAVLDDYVPALYPSRHAFRLATRFAQVLVSWHDDVDADGVELGAATVRVALRESALRAFTERWVVAVEDWTPLLAPGAELPAFELRPYPLLPAIARQLGAEGK
jgi:hypothetical protein